MLHSACAFANAVYHKSWDERTPIEINIYPDKIQVYNVEGPMPPVTNTDLKQERVRSRQYRNRRVGDFLKELDLTEGRNTGFPKIYASLRNNGSPAPEFETDDTNRYFMATLHIHTAFLTNESELMTTVPQDVLQGVPQDVLRVVIGSMTDNPKVTREEIAEKLGVSVKTVGRYLKKLEPVVRYEGSGYSGHWEIIVPINQLLSN